MSSPGETNQQWSDNWAVASDSPQAAGGQGTVARVRSHDGSLEGALKCPHPDSLNTERRTRFRRETTALAQLQVEGVPNLLEHATDLDLATPYYVAEWVHGRTLDRVGRVDLGQAIDLVLSLARIVQQCHECGIAHRDIKPQNIILDPDDSLWLVDFGLVWFAEPVDEFRTALASEVGNRFLRLPEHQAGTESHSFVADVTFVVGILFFLLTGTSPRGLFNESGEPPHRSYAWPPELQADARWARVERVFDRGFLVDASLRFQSASEIVEILAPPENPARSPVAKDAQALSERLDGLRQSQAAVLDGRLVSALKTFTADLSAAATELGFTIGRNEPSLGPTKRFNLNLNTDAHHLNAPSTVHCSSGNGATRITQEGGNPGQNITGEEIVLFDGPTGDITGIQQALSAAVPKSLDALARHLSQRISGE